MSRRATREPIPAAEVQAFAPPTFDWDPGAVRTLSERLAETIREAIIRGDLRPGQPLRQVELSRRLRVSFAPLREAMRQLEAEGFVRFTAFQGAVVAPLETCELRDFIDILAAIESIAARAAVPAITPAVLVEAERLYAELICEQELGRAVGLVLRIRLTLYAPSGRRRLIDTVRLIRLNSHRWARHAYIDPEGRRLAEEICRGLIDRFRAGDADGAGRFVEDTYRAAQQLLERAAEEVARRTDDAVPIDTVLLALPRAAPRRRPATRRAGTRVVARAVPRRGLD